MDQEESTKMQEENERLTGELRALKETEEENERLKQEVEALKEAQGNGAETEELLLDVSMELEASKKQVSDYEDLLIDLQEEVETLTQAGGGGGGDVAALRAENKKLAADLDESMAMLAEEMEKSELLADELASKE